MFITYKVTAFVRCRNASVNKHANEKIIKNG